MFTVVIEIRSMFLDRQIFSPFILFFPASLPPSLPSSCFCRCRLAWVLSVVFFILLLLFLRNQFSVSDEWRKGFQQCFSDLNVHMNHLGAFRNADFDSVTLGWGLRCCISKQLPGNAGVAGPLAILEQQRAILYM